MLTRLFIGLLSVLLVTTSAQGDRPATPRPGHVFQSLATQAQQRDHSINPGLLWVEQGIAQFQSVEGGAGQACASCHQLEQEPFTSAATRFPRAAADGRRLINLEGQINECRTERMRAAPLAYESSDLLNLTAALTFQARGKPRRVAIDGPTAPFFAQGRALWQSRQGQLNLACSQCHDDNVGGKLRGDTISQGQSEGWPAYRLEWQTLGSLHRRLRACSLGVRAEVLDYGAPEYLALELYLAWRGGPLPLESPGIRR